MRVVAPRFTVAARLMLVGHDVKSAGRRPVVDAKLPKMEADDLRSRPQVDPDRIAWLDAKLHIDLYDGEPYVTQAVDAVTAFLAEHL